jgi:hypothetical protein
LAQTPAAFVGTWKVTWQGAKAMLEAKLVVSESGGTWKTISYNREDPCVGLEAPIVVDKVNGDEARIRLKFSEAMSGCSDATIRVKKLNDNAMSGTRGKAELTITRQ